MRKALVLPLHSNQIELHDAVCLKDGLEKGGFEVDVVPLKQLDSVVDSLPISSYDFIGIWPSHSAMFVSGGHHKDSMLKVTRGAKEGALYVIACDVKHPFTPFMWNKGENASEDKVDIFKDLPVTVFGSFSKDILKDEKAMERANFLWMRKLSSESEFIPLEWNLFHIGKSYEMLKDFADNGVPYEGPQINRFYYGLQKPKIAKSLRLMGMGTDPGDATFGGISTCFKNVTALCQKPTKRGMDFGTPRYFMPIARKSDILLFPYEPIKGDYQVTKRLVEYAAIGHKNVQFDDRISDYIKNFTDLSYWRKRSDEVSQEISDIVDSKIS